MSNDKIKSSMSVPGISECHEKTFSTRALKQSPLDNYVSKHQYPFKASLNLDPIQRLDIRY